MSTDTPSGESAGSYSVRRRRVPCPAGCGRDIGPTGLILHLSTQHPEYELPGLVSQPPAPPLWRVPRTFPIGALPPALHRTRF